ncbi:MAG: nicotinate-nucleotide adenylyltransferase [Clostridia bacterium]|nr:nicotinate-nucleotide adenylyltransferase [Clostridia bacterium]
MAGKIAVFGGSFNPIHSGHLMVAMCAMKECNLQKIIFLPNANPPHKDKLGVISEVHRYNMVSLAIKDTPFFEISDYEMNPFSPSYTINTIRHFKSFYNAEVFFIIGADSLYTLDKWRAYEDLIKECSFIVANRNSKYGSDFSEAIRKHIEKGGRIESISMPKIDITSTLIRDKLQRGEDVSKYVPQSVNDYIIKNGLYKSNPED